MSDNKNLENFNCPICESTSGVVLQEFDSKNAVERLVQYDKSYNRDFLEKHIESLWSTRVCRFILCQNCTLSYAQPFIAGDAIFYQEVYKDNINYPKWKWEFDKSFRKVESIIKDSQNLNTTLLEVGAGNGNFVNNICKSLIKPRNILTTEFSKAGSAEIAKLNIECKSSAIWDVCTAENKEKFDFICMFQVLEHMDNLDKVFNSLSFLSKNMGHVFIAVPNNIHREYFETLGFIEDVPPTHISRWSKQSFEYVANKYGWELLDYEIEPNKLYRNIAKYLQFKYQDIGVVKYINRIKSLKIRHALKLVVLSPFILINIRKLWNLGSADLGIVQFVEFRKVMKK